jgi:hypothetical protein
VPSRFEDKTVRTLANPKLEPRNSAARTPHRLLNGTITPNGLHFVIARGGFWCRGTAVLYGDPHKPGFGQPGSSVVDAALPAINRSSGLGSACTLPHSAAPGSLSGRL